jgi:hypothetical protein
MVGLQTLDLAIGVRVPASQPNRIKHLRGGPKTEPPVLCAYSVPNLKSGLLCAGFREKHSLQLVRGTLLHVWQDLPISVHCEFNRAVTKPLTYGLGILIRIA